MFTYHQFSIADTDHFVPSHFPELETSIEQVMLQLAKEPRVKNDMVLSFVKDHCMNSAHVKEHSKLAELIASKSIPLHLMEALFEAGRNNKVFKKELEEYIYQRLATGSAVNDLTHSTTEHA